MFKVQKLIQLAYLRIAAVAIAATFQLGFAYAAQNEYMPNKASGGVCIFDGEITKAEVPRFKANLARGCRRLFLSSAGGNIDAAIEMGGAIRAQRMSVVVLGAPSFCKSACVFLYAGGVMRLPYSPIEIHRPYLPSSQDSFSTTQKKYQEIEFKIKAYLRSVNVSERLFDLMMKVPPQQLEGLTIEEMTDLGMGMRDPVYYEYLDNKKAAKSGFSKREWLQSTLAAKQKCGDIDAIIPSDKTGEIILCWKKDFPQFFEIVE